MCRDIFQVIGNYPLVGIFYCGQRSSRGQLVITTDRFLQNRSWLPPDYRGHF